MMKFILNEALDMAMQEPSSPAADVAKQSGLQHVGFGRYRNPGTGQVSHIAQNDELVPVGTAYKSNSYKQNSTDDMGMFIQAMEPERDEIHSLLTQTFTPELYSNSELKAIKSFTEDPSVVNDKLMQLPMLVSAIDLQPDYEGDDTPQTIIDLDGAVNRAAVPVDVVAYLTLDDDFDSSSLKPGDNIQFKTFRSLSLDFGLIANSGSIDPGETKKISTVFQIILKAGTPGIYADDYSINPGEYEFILPRGSAITIVDGPITMIGSSAQFNINHHEINYFVCETV